MVAAAARHLLLLLEPLRLLPRQPLGLLLGREPRLLSLLLGARRLLLGRRLLALLLLRRLLRRALRRLRRGGVASEELRRIAPELRQNCARVALAFAARSASFCAFTAAFAASFSARACSRSRFFFERSFLLAPIVASPSRTRS